MNTNRWLRRAALAALIFSLFSRIACAGIADMEDLEDFDPADVDLTPIAGPFEFPSSMALLPDGSVLISERAGRLRLATPEATIHDIGGLPTILAIHHAGLIDIALDPDFAKNRLVYFSYSHGTELSSTIRVSRAVLDRRTFRLRRSRVIFESTPATGVEHLGGRMVVTADGYLFLTLGDRQERDRAQNLGDTSGSIIRIRTDGSVPPDNPFADSPSALSEIWSFGHRNPQGLALDPETGELWSHEHGALGGDEFNRIVRGTNYGWPIVTYGVEYSGDTIGEGVEREGLESPLHYWTPSDVAPSGLAVDTSGNSKHFWLGTLVGQSLVRLEWQNDRIVRETRLLKSKLGRIRDVRIGVDGHLYLAVDHPEAALYRVNLTQLNRLLEVHPRKRSAEETAPQ
ncbi:MAG: PQQ-dependent sugar dehydrogenase [Burkholderiales bacterium]|nr:PQQ-dependent sugar dehydrogenase [Burkholderiales bacterium]